MEIFEFLWSILGGIWFIGHDLRQRWRSRRATLSDVHIRLRTIAAEQGGRIVPGEYGCASVEMVIEAAAAHGLRLARKPAEEYLVLVPAAPAAGLEVQRA